MDTSDKINKSFIKSKLFFIINYFRDSLIQFLRQNPIIPQSEPIIRFQPPPSHQTNPQNSQVNSFNSPDNHRDNDNNSFPNNQNRFQNMISENNTGSVFPQRQYLFSDRSQNSMSNLNDNGNSKNPFYENNSPVNFLGNNYNQNSNPIIKNQLTDTDLYKKEKEANKNFIFEELLPVSINFEQMVNDLKGRDQVQYNDIFQNHSFIQQEKDLKNELCKKISDFLQSSNNNIRALNVLLSYFKINLCSFIAGTSKFSDFKTNLDSSLKEDSFNSFSKKGVFSINHNEIYKVFYGDNQIITQLLAYFQKIHDEKVFELKRKDPSCKKSLFSDSQEQMTEVFKLGSNIFIGKTLNYAEMKNNYNDFVHALRNICYLLLERLVFNEKLKSFLKFTRTPASQQLENIIILYSATRLESIVNRTEAFYINKGGLFFGVEWTSLLPTDGQLISYLILHDLAILIPNKVIFQTIGKLNNCKFLFLFIFQ